jgi:hypothetical protein
VFWKAVERVLITRQIISDLMNKSTCYSGEKSIYIMKPITRARGAHEEAIEDHRIVERSYASSVCEKPANPYPSIVPVHLRLRRRS